MSLVAYVDLGASRHKCAFSEGSGPLFGEVGCEAPKLTRANLTATAPVSAYVESVRGLLLQAPDGRPVSEIWFASEMHGCAIAVDNAALQYLSWQDERALVRDFVLDADDWAQRSQMRLRPGLAALTLSSLKLAHETSLLTLPEALCVASGGEACGCHITLAASTGLCEWKSSDWCADWLEKLRVRVNPIRRSGDVIGQFELNGRRIPCFGAVGDLQASVFGCGFGSTSSATACVNLGTGSQALTITSGAVPAGCEGRPYFSDRQLSAITHIPCGRALSAWSRLWDEIAGRAGAFWAVLADLNSDEILAAPWAVDLQVFAASDTFSGGGAISKMREQQFSARILAASIALGWIRQYSDALQRLCHGLPSSILVVGRLAQRVPAFREVIAAETRAEVIIGTEEGAIAGLHKLRSLGTASYIKS